MLHRFLCVILALGSMLATSAFLHALFPPRLPEGVAAKLEFFSRHKNEFDTVFLGTSRIYYAVSPEIFDLELTDRAGALREAAGLDVREPQRV